MFCVQRPPPSRTERPSPRRKYIDESKSNRQTCVTCWYIRSCVVHLSDGPGKCARNSRANASRRCGGGFGRLCSVVVNRSS